MHRIIIVSGALMLAAVVQAADAKNSCALPDFNSANPKLEMLNLTTAEKAKITALARRGKKIDAIRMMRKCEGMSLAEQKAIVEKLLPAY